MLFTLLLYDIYPVSYYYYHFKCLLTIKVPTTDSWMAERNYHQSLLLGKAEQDKFIAEMGPLFEVFKDHYFKKRFCLTFY